MTPAARPCGKCRRCLEETDERDMHGFPVRFSIFTVCPKCGNKRCPKADDHRFRCTWSNATGQTGELE